MTTRVAWAYHFHDRDWLGGKNYFASLFRAIAARPPDGVEFVFVTGEKTQTSLPTEFPWLEVLRTPVFDRGHPAWLARQATLRLGDRDPLLERYLRRHRVDVLSHSGYLGPKSAIKVLPWLYDFQFMHLPEYWQAKHIRWAEQRYAASCRYSDAIIVSSHDAARDLERFAPWCTRPRHVLQFVSNPVDFEQLPSKAEIAAKYELPDAFFYLPNQFWTNKNHGLAIDSLAILKQRGIPATIACTGKTADGRRPEYFDELVDRCRAAGVTDRLRILGVVPYSDMQGLMAHAVAVLNPSRFEGWSTTVEEAKTFQQRLLLSDIAVHREQSPEHGRFFDVDDSVTLAQLMIESLDEPPRRLDREAIELDYARRLRAFGDCYADILRPHLTSA